MSVNSTVWSTLSLRFIALSRQEELNLPSDGRPVGSVMMS